MTTLPETLVIPGTKKTESNNCFTIHCFKENNDKRTVARNKVYYFPKKKKRLLDNALGNRALRAHSTDNSLIF